MSCGAPIVASRTAPVREVIHDPSLARLVDFFDVQALAAAVLETLDAPAAARTMGELGRRSVQRFSQRAAVPCYEGFLAQARAAVASPVATSEA
jgi:glycosyltransferase involved in cell wall biosynthesis